MSQQLPGEQMHEPINALMLQFLEWLSQRPRTYAEAMDAWQSSCPRHTTWEDALGEGWIRIEGTDEHSHVTLTPQGKNVLNENCKRQESNRRN
jgi:hypothetical protein